MSITGFGLLFIRIRFATPSQMSKLMARRLRLNTCTSPIKVSSPFSSFHGSPVLKKIQKSTSIQAECHKSPPDKVAIILTDFSEHMDLKY